MGVRRREGRGGDASVVGAFPVESRDGGSESVLLRQAIRAYTDQLDKISGRCWTDGDGDQMSRFFCYARRRISRDFWRIWCLPVLPSAYTYTRHFRERITDTAEGSRVHT